MSLVLGMGCSTGAPPDEVHAWVRATLRAHGLEPAEAKAVATIDGKAQEPAIAGLGLPVVAHPAAALAAVPVPTPSAVVEAAVGTPSVAEAAALLTAGPGAVLVLAKQRCATATLAVARTPPLLGSATP